MNIYRSVGDGDNNNNQRKGELTADVRVSLRARMLSGMQLLQLSFSLNSSRERFSGCNPPPATTGQGFAPSTRQLRAPAAPPCPWGSVHACPSSHAHLKNILCSRVSGCLVCAWPRAARVPVQGDTLWVCRGQEGEHCPTPPALLVQGPQSSKRK